MKKWFIPLIAIIGSLIARLHGGDNKIPKQIEAFLWALPQAYVASLATDNIVATIVLVTTMFAMNTGHGQYFSFARWYEKVTPERLDALVKPFFGDDPRFTYEGKPYERPIIYDKLYFRNLFGMTLKGIVRVLPCALALYATPALALLLVFGGALTGLAYAFAHEIFDLRQHPTMYGEYASGFFAFLTLAIVWSGL